MTHASSTMRTNLNINSILSAVMLIFIAITSFFLVRLVNQFDGQEGRISSSEKAVIELKGTLKVLEERTLTIDRRSETMDKKLDKLWESQKK